MLIDSYLIYISFALDTCALICTQKEKKQTNNCTLYCTCTSMSPLETPPSCLVVPSLPSPSGRPQAMHSILHMPKHNITIFQDSSFVLQSHICCCYQPFPARELKIWSQKLIPFIWVATMLVQHHYLTLQFCKIELAPGLLSPVMAVELPSCHLNLI